MINTEPGNRSVRLSLSKRSEEHGQSICARGTDGERRREAKSFYGKLFDWKLEDMSTPATPDHAYTMIKVGDGTGGGLMKNPIPGAPSAWLAYVLVDDVKAATSKAKSLGGNVMKDRTEVPGMGWFSIITDPTGAMLGLWETKKN